ncbi:MAG TPA: adenylate/guanylate cyclase domain-containing protein [Xanthobacteraceae bacterium]|nr:adenylate/guanylate cyclase domain-containing protein [Xanthobacteraceae bacterium]
MSDLRGWLRAQNLEQLAETFEANDIDIDILSELTDGDLEKLGVSIGNRRRLLKAISEGTAKSPESKAASTEALGAFAPSEATGAERRQVTVLFCDMVGSTALSEAVDPELLGALIRRYQDAAAGAIGRYGGFVAKFMGDGVLAYFGFPHAFEDAAERAVRAAIGILAQIGKIARPDGAALQARVGIATGLVVVGEIIGAGSAQERTIVGETPNLAARLQALAAPNTILISEATQNLLGGLFELESAGAHELKGFARPMPVWRVVREGAIESRFAAIRAGAATPLIGRAHEMGLLLDRWRLARQGEGQVVTLVGEAGIGKSRLIEALQEAVATEPHGVLYWQCSPYHSDNALYPVIHHISRNAGFVSGDSSAARIGKLSALFSQRAAVDPAAVPLLAELLSVPDAPPVPGSPMPAQRKMATIGLLADEIVRRGEAKPMVLIVEDAHWSDATTLELLTRIADGIARARLLIVVTARPDFAPPWLTRAQSTFLTLGRLGRTDCADLIAGIAASHGLSRDTVAAIVEKTDGVPLFVEELTKSVVESAGEGGGAVPASLKDSLAARLDRLGEAREIAQVAAVIGRQFSLPLLEAVSPKPGAELEAALAKLVATGIVFPEGGGTEQRFSFKHALLRDAAYESLLMARRREWHERTARVLEEGFPEAAANEPELLAHHFGEAGLNEKACEYRMRAGDRALSRSAYNEAIANFSAGLKAAEALLPSPEAMRHQLDLLLKLGVARGIVHGMQSAAAEEAYRRAAEIAENLGDGNAAYRAKWGLWLNANLGRRTALARDRAQELVRLAQRSGDGDLLLEAYHCRWSTAIFRGEVASAIADGSRGIESYDLARHRHLGIAFGGHDPGVCAHVCSSLALQMAGDRERSKDLQVRGLALAETLDHPNTIAHALYNIAMGHQMARDHEATAYCAQRALTLAEKFGLQAWRASSLLLLAWAGTGTAEAARLIDTEIDSATRVGPVPQVYLGLAGEVLLAVGRSADGLAYLDDAIAGIDEPGVGLYLPEIYRLRGECLLAIDRGNKEQARQAFTTAADIGRRQGAILFQRRAEASLRELAG